MINVRSYTAENIVYFLQTRFLCNWRVKRAELIRTISQRARESGLLWVMIREGGNHSIFTLGDHHVPIPRHREIPDVLARKIMKELESELGEGWWNR